MPPLLGRKHLLVAKAPSGAASVAAAVENGDSASASAIKPLTTAAPPEATPSAVEPHEDTHELDVGTIDWLGIITIVAGCSCFCLAVVWGGGKYEWNSPTIIALLVSAAILIAVFACIEIFVATDPIMPMRLYKLRNFLVPALISFFGGFAMLGNYVYLPIFFQYVKLQTATQSGISMIPMMLSLPVGAMLSGALITTQPKLGYRIWAILGAAGIVVSNAIYTTFSSSTSNANLVGVLILGGL